jgi:hypothetical protein
VVLIALAILVGAVIVHSGLTALRRAIEEMNDPAVLAALADKLAAKRAQIEAALKQP